MAGNPPTTKNEVSQSTRSWITIALLLCTFVIPLIGVVGVFVMWFWTTWKKWVKILITIPFTLIPLSIIFLIFYIFIARPFQFVGDSMYPTFKNNEYIMANILAVRTVGLKDGDVIVFQSPLDMDKDLVKRVIGIPGDTVELIDGYVYVNEKKLDESAYLNSDVRTYGGAFTKDLQPFTIPANNYYVLGDNRPFSSDSREWGLVPHKNIIGKVDFCYWNCK